MNVSRHTTDITEATKTSGCIRVNKCVEEWLGGSQLGSGSAFLLWSFGAPAPVTLKSRLGAAQHRMRDPIRHGLLSSPGTLWAQERLSKVSLFQIAIRTTMPVLALRGIPQSNPLLAALLTRYPLLKPSFTLLVSRRSFSLALLDPYLPFLRIPLSRPGPRPLRPSVLDIYDLPTRSLAENFPTDNPVRSHLLRFFIPFPTIGYNPLASLQPSLFSQCFASRERCLYGLLPTLAPHLRFEKHSTVPTLLSVQVVQSEISMRFSVLEYCPTSLPQGMVVQSSVDSGLDIFNESVYMNRTGGSAPYFLLLHPLSGSEVGVKALGAESVKQNGETVPVGTPPHLLGQLEKCLSPSFAPCTARTIPSLAPRHCPKVGVHPPGVTVSLVPELRHLRIVHALDAEFVKQDGNKVPKARGPSFFLQVENCLSPSFTSWEAQTIRAALSNQRTWWVETDRHNLYHQGHGIGGFHPVLTSSANRMFVKPIQKIGTSSSSVGTSGPTPSPNSIF
ncbi:hypothetical protein NMY22_g16748 [Coprinellus aureogranulatus]|nr:hypothetical protein NMY22_g16748 [Coprinellus aureogranulatus]